MLRNGLSDAARKLAEVVSTKVETEKLPFAGATGVSPFKGASFQRGDVGEEVQLTYERIERVAVAGTILQAQLAVLQPHRRPLAVS